MKTFISIFLIAILISCSTKQEEYAEETTAPEESRYSYSNNFETADPAYMKLVRDWNNAIVTGDLDLAFSFVADSMDVILADGTTFNTTADSMRIIIDQMLSDFTSISINYMAGLSVTNKENNESWVLSYTDETFENTEGSQRTYVHELYRIEDGKIRSMYQYAQVPGEDDEPGEPQDGVYSYSGSFEVVDNNNMEIVNGWIDAVSSNDWEKGMGYLADSVSIILADGMTINESKEGLIEMGKEMFAGTSLEIEFAAAISVNSTPQNTDWVLSWTNEKYTKGDSVESTIIHEAYMIEDGKITFVRQFARPDTN